jgi:hypothetical protein
MIRGLRETIAFAAVASMTVGVGIGLSAAGPGKVNRHGLVQVY